MIKVGIIDSGVDGAEQGISIFEDEQGRICHLDSGFDYDSLNHGDAVAQLIGKSENVQFFSVKVFFDELYTSSNVLIEAIKWCVELHMDVINISLGLNPEDEEERRKIELVCADAIKQGVIIVAAFDSQYCLPASIDGVLGVEMNNQLQIGQYKSNAEGRFFVNGEYTYISREKHGAYGLVGSSFSCARFTRMVISAISEKPGQDVFRICELLQRREKYGLTDINEYDRKESCGVFFLNNCVRPFLENDEVSFFNISTVYVSEAFGSDLESDRKRLIVPVCLKDVFEKACELGPIFEGIDTIIIPSMTFMQDNVEDFGRKLIDLMIRMAELHKNVVYLDSFESSEQESISSFFRNKECRLYHDSIMSKKTGGKTEEVKGTRTLLVSASRIVDSILLECCVQNENKDSGALLISTNKNTELIGGVSAAELFHDKLFSFDFKKKKLMEAIGSLISLDLSREVVLSIGYPLLQFASYMGRDQDYSNFIDFVLAFNPDEIKIVVNQGDEIEDICAAVSTVEIITSKKVDEIYLSNKAYFHEDKKGYLLYTSIPIDEKKQDKLYTELGKAFPDKYICHI